MSKKFCFRTPFGSQRVNWYKTQMKFARLYFFPNVLSFWQIMELEKVPFSHMQNHRTVC